MAEGGKNGGKRADGLEKAGGGGGGGAATRALTHRDRMEQGRPLGIHHTYSAYMANAHTQTHSHTHTYKLRGLSARHLDVSIC